MLILGSRSGVIGGAAGAQARPGAARLFVVRTLRAGLALAGVALAVPACAAASVGTEPVIALPLWLFWLAAATLLGLGAGLFAQTVRTRRSLQRERLANRLIDHSPQLVCVLDPNGAVRHMNGTGRHWLRVTHPEIAGRRLDEIAQFGIVEPQAAALRDAVAQAVDGTVVTHELTARRPDGVAVTLELSIRAIPRTRDVPPNLLVEGRDITKRKSVEDKLHLAAAVFEQAREGFVIADRDGRVVTVNQDRKSTRLNSSHRIASRMPSSA